MRHRRARVQHGVVGVPGGRDRPELRRPGGGVHLPPHRQLRRHPRRRRGRPRPSVAASWCAIFPPAVFVARRRGLRDLPRAARVFPASPGWTPAGLTRHLRTEGAMGVRLRHRPRARASPPRPPPSRVPPDATWCATCRRPRRTRWGTVPAVWWRTTSASRRPCCAPWGDGDRDGGPRRPPRR